MIQKITTFLQQFQLQFKSFYAGLTTGRKVAISVGFAFLLSMLILALVYSPSKQFEVAYSGLAREDQTAILAFLQKNNIRDFQLEGDTLLFPAEKSLDIKMLLAQEGLPNSGSGVGWEKFDERAFGLTDFDQKVNKMRAIQGELSRTINKLEPVDNSRIHIVMPDDALFSSDKKSPTASIYLKLKRGKTLSQRQVQGILHLTARAVEGLTPDNIAIVDSEGNMLTKVEEDDGGLDKVTSTQREHTKKLERELENKIRDILGRVVGFDKVVAKVQADIEFKKVETTIQDVDPERTALLSSSRSEQSSQGAGLNPTGVPGVKSNLPNEKDDLQVGGSSQQSKQNSEVLNFDTKRTVSKIVEPVGTLKKMSAAVLVDGKMVDGKFQARSQDELNMITKLVKNAIGFQENRDSITVESAQFELDEFAIAERTAVTARRTSIIQTAILAIVAMAAMFFVYFAAVKPYFKWLTFDPEKRSLDQFPVMDYELERSGAHAKRVQVQEEIPFEKLSPKEQIMYLAKNDPNKTTEALRQLLSPQHS